MSSSYAFYLSLSLILVIYIPSFLSWPSDNLQLSTVFSGWSSNQSLQWKYGVQSGSGFYDVDAFGRASSNSNAVLIWNTLMLSRSSWPMLITHDHLSGIRGLPITLLVSTLSNDNSSNMRSGISSTDPSLPS